MSESTSSMSDSTSHDNGESTEYKLVFQQLSVSLVDVLLQLHIHDELSWRSSRQAAELAQRICITFKIHHSHLAGGRLICTSGV